MIDTNYFLREDVRIVTALLFSVLALALSMLALLLNVNPQKNTDNKKLQEEKETNEKRVQSFEIPIVNDVNEEAVELAYSLAVQSYETAIKRYDAVENRATALLGLFATVTFAIPTIGKLSEKSDQLIPVNTLCFRLSLLFFALSMIFNLLVKFTGELVVSSPSLHYKNWLTQTSVDFKRYFVREAGNAFDTNRSIIKLKHNYIILSSICFLVEGVLLSLWLFFRW
jgi:hypothetical protein